MYESSNRRKNKRHTVPESAFVLYNSRVGEIVNLSEGGMAVNLSGSRKPLSKEDGGSFYCRSTIKGIDKLSLKIVRKEEINSNGFGNYESQTIGVEFNNLNTSQQEQIRQHISKVS
jgi:c-di-GMP-binding flagellar brake protein YcgR